MDFLWLKGENEDIIFMQKNSQKFKIDHDSFKIRNFITAKGRFEFAISITNKSDFHSILDYVNSFYYKFIGIKIDENLEFDKKSGTFLSLEPPIELINLWRRKNNSYIRIFNPTNNQNNFQFDGPLIKNKLREIDFNYNEIKTLKKWQFKIDPWKIRTFKI